AQSCNVFWQVGSSATIQTSTQFAGNILALTSISMKTGATLLGRALARNAAVTLDTNKITSAACTQQAPTAPSATDTTATTETGHPVTIDLSGTDATGAPLTYVIVSGPSYGTLAPVDQGAGTVLYTPNGSYTGPDSLTFHVISSNGTSSPATVSVTITPAIAGATKTPDSATKTPDSATAIMPKTAAVGAPKPETDTGQDTLSSESTGTGDAPRSDISTVRTASSGPASQDTTRSPGLPFTGLNILWLLLAGTATLLAGATLRRRRGAQRQKRWAWLR
ncbi:MAG: ice-binding family protein, partial [Chloroflexota bacterium]